MIRISKTNDYNVVCRGSLALRIGCSMSTTKLFKQTELTIFSLQKLLKLLVSKTDFIKSNRGALGGYKLNKNSLEISVVENIEALVGPITVTSCEDNSENFCESNDICFFGEKWNKINEFLRNSLNEISLDDLLSYENPFLLINNKNVLIDKIY